LLATGVRLLADAVAAVADALPAAVRARDHVGAVFLAGGTLVAARAHEARSFTEAAGITEHEYHKA
jgi:hypothetical protein